MMFLLIAVIYILAQFIGEYMIIFGIIQYLPSFAAVLYGSKQVIIVVHLLITLALVIWAKRTSTKLYK